MKAALMCAVFAALEGVAGPRPDAVTPAMWTLASPQTPANPPAPRAKPPERDPQGSLKPVCTVLALPADARLDPEFAKPMMTPVDPGMVVPSGCRP
jgi:hypothetical protein